MRYAECVPSGTSLAKQLFLATLIVGCASTHDAPRLVFAGAAGAETGAAGAEAKSAGAEAGAAGARAGEVAEGGAGPAEKTASEPSYSLFNGVDFTGWDRYLGKPSDAEPPLGVDNDPRAVYSVVTLEGEAAIRISGEVWGSLISQRQFCNFRLRAQFKWGTSVWTIKDSGIMFLSGGPLGAVNAGGDPLSDPIGSGAFMVSTEYQIAPGDVGSLYNLGPIAFASALHSVEPEQPEDWNQVEISLRADQASLLLNGHEVSHASGFVLNWPNQPPSALRCGLLQLQSEGAEIFFRRLEIAGVSIARGGCSMARFRC